MFIKILPHKTCFITSRVTLAELYAIIGKSTKYPKGSFYFTHNGTVLKNLKDIGKDDTLQLCTRNFGEFDRVKYIKECAGKELNLRDLLCFTRNYFGPNDSCN